MIQKAFVAMSLAIVISVQLVFNCHLLPTDEMFRQDNINSFVKDPDVDSTSRDIMVQNHDDRNGGLSVLSYSLYGNSSRYAFAMIQTAMQSQSIYPDWELRVYHDDEVPQDALQQLANITMVKLMNVNQEFPSWIANHVNPRCWRYLVASDPTVELYAIRDADSQPTLREKVAVEEWIRSGTTFHIMRDHPLHDPHGFAVILAGMWGGRRSITDSHRHSVASNSTNMDMTKLLFDFYVNNQTRSSAREANGKFVYTDDQDFLWKYIVPLARNDCLQHDSYHCVESGGVAFPMTRQEAGNEFMYVGNSLNRLLYNDGTVHSSMHDFDSTMMDKEMVDRYNLCLQLRHNLTNHLIQTVGSSSVLKATPYIGSASKTSTELWDDTQNLLMSKQGV